MKTPALDHVDSDHAFPVSPSVYHELGSRSAMTGRLKLKMKRTKERVGPVQKNTINPDPRAPEITNHCFVCGKEFKSAKALYGHMRKHPERSWRGCNPPSNTQPFSKQSGSQTAPRIDPDDNIEVDIAFCLILLSEGKSNDKSTTSTASDHTGSTSYNIAVENSGGDGNLFKCSSCDKKFRTHQALGGHRASHKNVKGCFAITKSSPTTITTTTTTTTATTTESTSVFGEKRQMQNESPCGCQAHLRSSPQTGVEVDGFRGLGLDLNLPAPMESDDDDYDDSSPNSASSYFRRFI
ncbi:zinc finger protein ZAT2-like [Humulus lupulus]|uniref:zinc finger protein ZAT2-like n=1 Tax=Humulus lupulus TaxID=3486 RepID=UPI002B412321|nr:zinc finger protein ZAT2-like [Humulus lupulus]